MRVPPLLAAILLVALPIASSSPAAVTMAWTPVGNPGNACDPQLQGCLGSVSYEYRVGTYEVTNAQYAEFLNAKAPSDPLGLYNTAMGDPQGYGGITRTGSSGTYIYTTVAGRENKPVGDVSFYDALRFANWLNNGQGSGDTETGAYTLLGGTATPSNGTTVTRNAGAAIFLTSEDEWYKGAYAIPTGGYLAYPAYPNPMDPNEQTHCSTPTGTANRANCNFQVGDLTDEGSYADSGSPYGTFDQGGNVAEWNEALINVANRGVRGGNFSDNPSILAASTQGSTSPTNENDAIGFRVASVPEPSGTLGLAASLVMLVGLTGWRRGRT
jgi:formylglycine-generating enzyme required for sulfatase activity